jgi:hypothetical protein
MLKILKPGIITSIRTMNSLTKKLISNKQNKDSLTVFHYNICGPLNKKEELLDSLTRNSPQIICKTEHRLIEELPIYFGSQIL